MTNDNASIVGKPVKDMYGTTFGTVLGILTHIDGSIQTVGVDCGSEGFKQIPYEQFVFCLLYTSPSPRDRTRSRMPSSA